MNQKGFANIILIIIIIILAGAVGYFALVRKSESPPLSESTALSLTKIKWGDCTLDGDCSNISVTTKKQDNVWYITATYEGFRDDSVNATRYVVPAYYQNDTWVLGEPVSTTYRCQQGRGQQDFSEKLCL